MSSSSSPSLSSKTKSGNPLIFLYKRLWEYSKGNRGTVLRYSAMFIVANSLYLLNPLVIAWILNFIQQTGVSFENLPKIAGAFSILVAIDLGFWSLHGPARVVEIKNAFMVRAGYKKHLLQGVMGLPASWHTHHHSGDTIDKVEKGSEALFHFSSGTFMTIESIVRSIGSFTALALFDLSASATVVLIGLSVFQIVRMFDKKIIPNYKLLNKAQNSISETIFDSISNITTVITLRMEKVILSEVTRKILEPFKLDTRTNKLNETKWFIAGILNSAMISIVLVLYIWNNLRTGDAVLIGTLYALYGYVHNITSVFFHFTWQYSEMVRQRAAVANSEELSKEFRKKEGVKQIKLGPKWKNLSLESLDFSYHSEKKEKLHLRNISMMIGRGEKIALVGESGAGKSTFLKIFRGLHTPREMRLLLDGQPVPVGFKGISDEVALIPQEPEVFATTILGNITMGVRHGMKEIRRYADMAAFTEVVESLPKKFHSSMVEKGVSLSGGEKQRLASARGLMAARDRAILLLDEPTSSIDSKNERLIYENIFKNFRGTTIISTVHRLHLLPLFDSVYVFREGKIIASGGFQELLKNSPEFIRMWEKYNQGGEE